jgi:hypothetical protein
MKRHPDVGIRISFDQMADKPVRGLKKAPETLLRPLKGWIMGGKLSRRGTLSCS